MGLPTAIVVDDDKDTVGVFCEYLEFKDVEVVGRGYNGQEAVRLYHNLKPDLVFLDLKMPEYDGIYAIKVIRAKDPNAKIIVVTGNYVNDTYPELDQLKPNAVLYKPFEINQVMKVVHELMNIETKQKS